MAGGTFWDLEIVLVVLWLECCGGSEVAGDQLSGAGGGVVIGMLSFECFLVGVKWLEMVGGGGTAPLLARGGR